MKTFIFGFGWEILGFTIYALVWGWFCSLLESRVAWLKGKVFLISILAVAMLHPFVVNYLVVVFWFLISITAALLWGEPTKDWVNEKLSWVTAFNGQVARIAILITVFVIFRHVMFQHYPEKMWY